MSSLLQSYNEALHLLTETEEKIVSFVINNPEQSLEFSIHELAARLEISPSMIVKAAKKLGFTGYSQLKLAIASELNILVQREKSSVLIEDLEAYDELVSTTIREAYCRVSEEVIEEAARVLSSSQIIDIYAFGFDAIAGHDLYLKMLQSGKRVQLIENGYEQMISAYSLESPGKLLLETGISRRRPRHSNRPADDCRCAVHEVSPNLRRKVRRKVLEISRSS